VGRYGTTLDYARQTFDALRQHGIHDRRLAPPAGTWPATESRPGHAPARAPAYTDGMNIADIRKSYEKAELSEAHSQADPLMQFDQWLKEAIASEVPEPNAMTVATVGPDLRPQHPAWC
jgi:hypothetical protein